MYVCVCVHGGKGMNTCDISKCAFVVAWEGGTGGRYIVRRNYHTHTHEGLLWRLLLLPLQHRLVHGQPVLQVLTVWPLGQLRLVLLATDKQTNEQT